jgi:hypothetical protein
MVPLTLRCPAVPAAWLWELPTDRVLSWIMRRPAWPVRVSKFTSTPTARKVGARRRSTLLKARPFLGQAFCFVTSLRTCIVHVLSHACERAPWHRSGRHCVSHHWLGRSLARAEQGSRLATGRQMRAVFPANLQVFCREKSGNECLNSVCLCPLRVRGRCGHPWRRSNTACAPSHTIALRWWLYGGITQRLLRWPTPCSRP